MDFAGALATVGSEIEQRGFRYAVIGGVALAALGLPRSTLDLDLVTESAAQDLIVRFLEALGYETLHRSSGYSNHLHPDPERGRLDFVYVNEDTAEKLFGSVHLLPGPGGALIPVPSPEHLAAMKVMAVKNDPARTFQDLADVRFLLTLPGVDRGAIRSYFERHGLLQRYLDVEGTL